MRISQPKEFTRLLLAASISIASFSLVACGGDSSNDTHEVATSATSYYLASYNGNVTPTTVGSWEATHKDEEINKLQVDNGNLTIFKQWHNGIIKVATDSYDSIAEPIAFGSLTTAGDGKASSDEDYISGASEHKLLESWNAEDNSAMYALVAKPKGATVAEDDTYGLFKVPLNSDGSVPFSEVKGKKVYHREPGVERVGEELNLTKVLPLTDGRILALSKEMEAVAVYSSDLTELDQSASFSVKNKEVKSWVANANGAYLIVKDSNNNLTLQKHHLDSLATTTKSLPLDASGYLLANNNNDSIMLASGYGVTIYDANLAVTANIGLPSKITDASLSTDGKRLAVKTENKGEVVLIDIADKSSAITTINLGDEIIHFAMGDKQTLFANFEETGEVQKFELTANTIALTADELLTTALKNITAESVNHGYHGSAVRYDLSIPSNQSGGLPNVSYQWTSNSSAVDVTTGTIQRPAKGSQPTDVTLSLIATATTNGESKTDTKTIELQILPQEATISYDTDYDLPEQFQGTQYRVIDINHDGSKLAMFARKSGKLLIMEHGDVNNGTGGFVAPASYIDLPAPYNGKVDAPVLLWKDSNTILVVANKGSNDVGAVLSYDVSSNSWTTLVTLDSPVAGAEFTDNKQNLTLVLEKTDSNGDDTYQMMVKKASDMTDVNSYSLPIEVQRYTVSNDGNIIYAFTKNEDTDAYELVRFNQGVKDFTYAMPSKIYDFQVHGDKLVFGDYYGDIYTIENAMTSTPPTQSQIIVTYTARNDFDGASYSDDDHIGRNYITANTDSQIFTMYREVGMSIYNRTDNGYVEDSFIADGDIYRVFISGNEKKMFTYDRSNSRVHFLDLQ